MRKISKCCKFYLPIPNATDDYEQIIMNSLSLRLFSVIYSVFHPCKDNQVNLRLNGSYLFVVAYKPWGRGTLFIESGPNFY